jgi:hypothetical protein
MLRTTGINSESFERAKKVQKQEEKVCAGCHENITDSKHGTCNVIATGK